MDRSRKRSRDVDIFDYEQVPFIEEQKNTVGDVYVVNTDVYHSFKCVGTVPRLVLQTKFEGYPDFETVRKSLLKRSFSNLIKESDK